MTGIGWNIHLSYCTDAYIDQMIAEFKRTKPGALLLLDSFGDSIGDTLRFARELPETTIIYRRFIEDGQQFDRSIEQWGAQVSSFRGTRVYCSITNEPNAVQSFEYLTRAIRYASNNGLKIAVGAYSVGTPHENDLPKADAMLRAMAAYPGGTLLEVHEYERALTTHTIAPNLKHPLQWPVNIDRNKNYYRMLRFKDWFELCDERGIRRPKIVISEWGWDRVDDVPPHIYGDTQGLMTLPGVWQSWGFGDWEHYAAEQLKWAWKHLYKPYGVDVCFFCRHNQPVDAAKPEALWQNFNAHRAPNFLTYTEQGFDRMTTPTIPNHTPYPTGKYTLSGNGVRVRDDDSLRGNIVATLNSGDGVAVTSTFIVYSDGYGWQAVKAGEVSGYMALHGDRVTWKLVDMATEPEPAPIDGDALRRIRDHAQAIVDECNAALEKAGSI